MISTVARRTHRIRAPSLLPCCAIDGSQLDFLDTKHQPENIGSRRCGRSTRRVPQVVHAAMGCPVGMHYTTSWRRECDWDPTVSEFVAIILLGRVRLGSNCRTENTGESASVVRDVPIAYGDDRPTPQIRKPGDTSGGLAVSTTTHRSNQPADA